MQIHNLVVQSYANGQTIWGYTEPNGLLGPMSTPGYFDDTADMFVVGDFIFLSARDGGRVAYVLEISPHVVLSPAT